MKFVSNNSKFIILSTVSLLGFVMIASAVLLGSATYFDGGAYDYFSLKSNATLAKVMTYISFILHPIFLFAGSVFIFAILFFRNKLFSFFFLGAVGISIASAMLLKDLFNIARPISAYANDFGLSFPSIHVTAATVFFLMLGYIISHKFSDKLVTYLFVVSSAAIIGISGLSRVYLAAHWFSDVLAGFLLGMFWVGVAIISYESFLENRVS